MANKNIILEKQEVINEVAKCLKDAQSVTVVEYRGISVAKLENLRKELRKDGSTLKVYKNTLVDRAAKNLGYDLTGNLAGPNAFVFSNKDAVSAPKILTKFAATEKSLVIKGGLVEGKVVDAKEMAKVAKLPTRDGLYSMLLSCLQSPLRGVACALKAIVDKEQTN